MYCLPHSFHPVSYLFACKRLFLFALLFFCLGFCCLLCLWLQIFFAEPCRVIFPALATCFRRPRICSDHIPVSKTPMWSTRGAVGSHELASNSARCYTTQTGATATTPETQRGKWGMVYWHRVNTFRQNLRVCWFLELDASARLTEPYFIRTWVAYIIRNMFHPSMKWTV